MVAKFLGGVGLSTTWFRTSQELFRTSDFGGDMCIKETEVKGSMGDGKRLECSRHPHAVLITGRDDFVKKFYEEHSGCN